MADGCVGDSCTMQPSENGTGSPACSSDKIVMYSRPTCGLCWMAKFQFWMAGVKYEVRPIDAPESRREWEAAIDKNGFPGGSFVLPVVVHGDKAWWSSASFKALAMELKGRTEAKLW